MADDEQVPGLLGRALRRARGAIADLRGVMAGVLDHADGIDATPRESIIAEIATERRRQIEVEGWTPAHDDTHGRGEMASAAACYAYRSNFSPEARSLLHDVPMMWPWSPRWWKPKDRRSDLIRAAALIVAEVERIDRAERKRAVA